MNAKKFSDAMSALDNKYIDEALSYNAKANHAKHLRRIPIALAAAILALFLMGAGVVAIIYGDSIQNWFSHYWEAITGQEMSDEHITTIDHLSQEIDVSQTIGNATVTVDSATVGDDNFFLLLRIEGLQFSNKQSYGFENINMNVKPDPLEGNDGIGSCGFQYHGLDGNGAALFLLDYNYASGSGYEKDTSPLDIALSLKNLIENAYTDKEELLIEGEWIFNFSYNYASGSGYEKDTSPLDIALSLKNLIENAYTDKEELLIEGEWIFNFSLDRSTLPDVINLPDTEVMAMDLERQELVPVTITNIELTSTGLRFRYDYADGTLSIESRISVVLDNGVTIRDSGGAGTPLDDGKTLNCSHQWLVPINLDKVSSVHIGETAIPIPS